MTTEEPRDPWRSYIEKTKDNPQRPFLIKAVELVKEKRTALDLGPGALNASKYLLDQGFGSVTAVDRIPAAEDIARSLPGDRFEYIASSFEEFNFPVDTYDLVNAEFSLPFIDPQQFGRVFNAVISSLKNGGVLTGQLFGDRDEWAKNHQKMTFHTEEQARELLSKLNVVEFVPDERDGKTALGKPKHWHIFHFIAQKTAAPIGTLPSFREDKRYSPSPEQEARLELLKQLTSQLEAAAIHYSIVGGYGLDGLYGELTRDHVDIDMLIDGKDIERTHSVLTRMGFGGVAIKNTGVEVHMHAPSETKLELATWEIMAPYAQGEKTIFLPENPNASLGGAPFRTATIEGQDRLHEIQTRRAQEGNWEEYPHTESRRILIGKIREKSENKR